MEEIDTFMGSKAVKFEEKILARFIAVKLSIVEKSLHVCVCLLTFIRDFSTSVYSFFFDFSNDFSEIIDL